MPAHGTTRHCIGGPAIDIKKATDGGGCVGFVETITPLAG